jgi:hypothetical protein
MGEWGKLQERFRFLSQKKRWVFFATNNAGKAENGRLIAGRNWGSSLLRVYYDGEELKMAKSNAAGISGKDLIRTTTSDDGRCRIVTLDIPNRLFI